MLLNTLIENLPLKVVSGDINQSIHRIDFDSRNVQKGSLFVAVRGTQTDGHAYLDKAIENGATAIIVEQLPETRSDQVIWIESADTSQTLGLLASRFYGEPSKHLRLVGVTGTNGKTTVVTLLHNLFSELGYRCGLLSTIENKIGQTIAPSTHTTPDAVSINALLAEMVAEGCTHAFMEVSSHAVDQKRIAGLQFAGGIFTNITHDHLDYHKTFQAYIEAKKGFFDGLGKGAFALINADDRRADVMVQNSKAVVYRFALKTMADFRARILENALSGLHLELDRQDFHGRLIGEFNAYNLLAIYGAAMLLGEKKEETLMALSQLKSAEGRFDYVEGGQRTIGIVDYAHTPDALEKVLSTINQLRKGAARIITVVGCGGDRDRSKRPEMAKIACRMSDQVILTSDNPRSEVPEAIIAEMEAGVPEDLSNRVLSITDRRQAIKTACKLAQSGDIILVAGKGHEKYQEIKGVKHPFDDKEILNEALKA